MAGLKATGWLPAASFSPIAPPHSGTAYMRTLATAGYRIAGPPSRSLAAAARSDTSAAAGWRSRDEQGGLGERIDNPSLSAERPRAIGCSSAYSTRSAYAGGGGGSPAYVAAGGERQQQQQPKRRAREDRQSPAEARAEAFERAVPEVFFLQGVSFGDRQQNIEAVDKGQPLLLHQEKTNPVDPNAVEVMSLHGHRLGYVPREMTGSYAYEWGLAYVESKGEAGDSGLTGVKVAAYPTLLPATVDAMPDNLARATRLSKVLPAADWDRLRTAAYQRARYRCEITGGAGEEQPVNATGLWMAHEDKKVMQLYGVVALAPSVARLKNLGALEDRVTAVQELCAINRWSKDDAAAYLKHIDVVRMLRSREEWKLELGWLESQGVAVPEALRPLCYTE